MKAPCPVPFVLAESVVKSIDAFETNTYPRGSSINLSLNAASVAAIPDKILRQECMRFARRVALVLRGKPDMADTELSRFVPQTPRVKAWHKTQERLVTASVTLRWHEKSMVIPEALGSKEVFKDLQTMAELFVGLLWHTGGSSQSASVNAEVQVRGLRLVRTVGAHFWMMDLNAETGNLHSQKEGCHKTRGVLPATKTSTIQYAVSLSLRRQRQKRLRGVGLSTHELTTSKEPSLKKQKQPICFQLKLAKVIPLKQQTNGAWPIAVHAMSSSSNPNGYG